MVRVVGLGGVMMAVLVLGTTIVVGAPLAGKDV